MTERILIVDDDPDIRTFLEVTLTLAGFEVEQAGDGAQAVEVALRAQPALVLMDVMMPNVDGLEAVRRLRADGRTSHIPVIMVTAKAQGTDKVAGLASGADDYVTKPFDPEELVARVQATLRRAGEMRTVSPLTGLPGNSRIELELARRVDGQRPFALLYADLNQFKAYNDYYGFMHGDQVLQRFGELVTDVVAELGDADSFVGHVGGDDFIVMCRPDQCREIAARLCVRFDELAPGFYRDDDRTRGGIEVVDRQGTVRQFPFVSVSIGIAHDSERPFSHPGEPVTIATEMKSFAKQASSGESNWAVDRRVGGHDPDQPAQA